MVTAISASSGVQADLARPAAASAGGSAIDRRKKTASLDAVGWPGPDQVVGASDTAGRGRIPFDAAVGVVSPHGPAARYRTIGLVRFPGGMEAVTVRSAPAADDDASREVADRTERKNPAWIVVFGIYTREFVCFPDFPRRAGWMVVAVSRTLSRPGCGRFGMPLGWALQETGRDRDPRPAPGWLRGGPEAPDVFPAWYDGSVRNALGSCQRGRGLACRGVGAGRGDVAKPVASGVGCLEGRRIVPRIAGL